MREIVDIEGIKELNTGHVIVAQAFFVGLAEAIQFIKRLME